MVTLKIGKDTMIQFVKEERVMEDDIKHLDNIVEDCAKKFLENHKDDINMVIEAKNASVVCIKDGYDYMFYLI